MSDTPFMKRAFNLGLKVAANFDTILTPYQVAYYEQNLDKIPEALRRGFAVPVVVEQTKKVVKKPVTYLHSLFAFRLGAVENKDTYKSARKVFSAYFGPDFESCGIVFSGPAPDTMLQVEELIRSGKFTDFLGNSAEELEKRRLSGHQFLAICRETTPDKLKGEDCINSFVLTRGDKPVLEDLSNVFVANVSVGGSGRLIADLYPFSDDRVWDGDLGHQTFFPKPFRN